MQTYNIYTATQLEVVMQIMNWSIQESFQQKHTFCHYTYDYI